MTYETLRAADDPGQALITYAATPGTPSHDALHMLPAWAAPPAATAPPGTDGRHRAIRNDSGPVPAPDGR